MFKILIVEDDRDLNQTVCAYLKGKGYEAIGCLSANDAYNEMYGNLFDMIRVFHFYFSHFQIVLFTNGN